MNESSSSVARNSASDLEQAIRDLLVDSALNPDSIVLDETATNPRAVIESVSRIVAPYAALNGLRLRLCVPAVMQRRVLMDGPRFGQILSYMLLHTFRSCRLDELTLLVRVEYMNRATQRITIDVIESGNRMASQPRSWFQDETAESSLSFHKTLANRMQGELAIASEPEAAMHARFAAPFTIEHDGHTRPATQRALPPLHDLSTAAERSLFATQSHNHEPFDSGYLDSLREEGVDLQQFLTDWHSAMNTDLAHLVNLSQRGDAAGLREVLHKLSGACGLVGAQSLVEALQGVRASSQPYGFDPIDMLTNRIRTLITQLDARSLERSKVR